jgi:hypothetical protein
MKKASILLYLALTFVYLNGNAQSCGTSVLANQIQLESTITITPLSSTQSLPKVNRNLSVAFYVVLDTLGNPGVSAAQINAAIAQLNIVFSPIDLQFHVCSINYIPNYQFESIQSGANENAVTVSFATKDVINVYLASYIYDPFKNQVNGYTYMPASSKNYIFLSKFSISGSELSHQMGHFFNLYHTHESTFGRENVARVNCDKTGDLCCDTEADPNVFGWVNSSCLFTGNLKDVNGVLYVPSAKNLMSYSLDGCRCYFSPTQYQRVAHAVLNLKKELR